MPVDLIQRRYDTMFGFCVLWTLGSHFHNDTPQKKKRFLSRKATPFHIYTIFSSNEDFQHCRVSIDSWFGVKHYTPLSLFCIFISIDGHHLSKQDADFGFELWIRITSKQILGFYQLWLRYSLDAVEKQKRGAKDGNKKWHWKKEKKMSARFIRNLAKKTIIHHGWHWPGFWILA